MSFLPSVVQMFCSTYEYDSDMWSCIGKEVKIEEQSLLNEFYHSIGSLLDKSNIRRCKLKMTKLRCYLKAVKLDPIGELKKYVQVLMSNLPKYFQECFDSLTSVFGILRILHMRIVYLLFFRKSLSLDILASWGV